MLERLREGPMTAAELSQPFQMSNGALSDHIRALRVSGLIAFRQRRNQYVYALVASRLRVVQRWSAGFKSSRLS
jgi:hypothetical protein